MDNQLFEQASASRSRQARVGWWLGLGLVVVLAVLLHSAYHPTQSANGAAAQLPGSIGLAAISAPAAFPRELVEMEAAGLVTLARPNTVPSTGSRAVFPRELVEMEAAGLVTLARP